MSTAAGRTRVWDRFLTDQDRNDDARRPAGEVGFGTKPCLLLVDLYRSAFGTRPLPLPTAVKEFPLSCGLAAWDALPRIEQLLAGAREAGLPVVHTTNSRARPLSPWFRKGRLGEAPASAGTAAAGGSPGEDDPDPIVESLAPQPDELVITKSSASPFWGTPLAGHLVGLGVDTVIVGGETTSGCVRAAVVDGCQFRFKMIVVEECVFDRHEASHAINLFDMHRKYADVLPLGEVLAHLGSARAGDARGDRHDGNPAPATPEEATQP